MKWRNLFASICLFACGAMLFAADKNPAPLSKTLDAPIERVYAAVVQVASADYNLKSAVKEGYTVSFFSGGQFSLVQAVGNPQVFGVGKARDREALRFWTELDKAIQINQGLTPDSNKSQGSATKDESAQVTVKSTPDGADITLDGKFAGSTPSTFQIKSGDHSIKIELSGFVPWEKSLTIAPGGQITLNANLQRKSADTQQ
jgi:hypothetical protein